MKLIIIKGNLRDALSTIERSVGENQNLPILRNVLISARDNKIKLTGTNLEVATTLTVPGKIIQDGSATVPAHVFSGLVNNLQTERLNIEKKGNDLELKTDNYQATIRGLPAEEFPIIPAVQTTAPAFSLSGEALKRCLTQVVPSAQASDARPELNSVYVVFSLDALKLVATDSFRLSEKTVSKNAIGDAAGDHKKFLLPLKTAQEALRIFKNEEPVRVLLDANQVLFASDGAELISRLIEGTFPDYGAIVPKKFETEAVFNREELLAALKLASVFSARVNEVRIRTSESKKALEISSGDQIAGENTYFLPAKIVGADRDMSFNWRYLSDGLRSIETEDVFFGMNEDNKPSLLRSTTDGSFFYLLTPILKA